MRPTSIDAAANVATNAHPLRAATLGWALRRTLLCLSILAIAISAMAWLTHASIDPRLEHAADDNVARPVVAR
jgi:hypothetical protein